jgi:hypothetical protein
VNYQTYLVPGISAKYDDTQYKGYWWNTEIERHRVRTASIVITVLFSIIYSISIALFFASVFMDPGYFPKVLSSTGVGFNES